jgi:hypothetical protein
LKETICVLWFRISRIATDSMQRSSTVSSRGRNRRFVGVLIDVLSTLLRRSFGVWRLEPLFVITGWPFGAGPESLYSELRTRKLDYRT